MKRRDFLTSIGLGSLAAGTFPSLTGCSSKQNDKKQMPAGTTDYDGNDRVRTGIALGGIGTGYVELRKDGKFYNWNIFNNNPKSTGPDFYINNAPYRSGWEDSLMFFVVRYQEEGKDPQMRLLQLPDTRYQGGVDNYGYIYIFPWLKAVENIEYTARFPFINMKFTDPEMPFDIEMETFTPFIPHDAKNSSLPGAYFNL